MDIAIVLGRLFSSNSFILYEKTINKILIIDIGFLARLSNYAIRKKIEKIFTKEKKDIEIEIFLTHCHMDHISGEDNFRNFENVTYSSSSLTAKHVNSRDEVTLLPKFHGKISFNVSKTYTNEELIPFGKNELIIINSPGHTDGCSVVYDKEKKNLFSGDVVFAGGASGRVDLPSGNQKALIESLERLSKLEINNLYSGHGPILNKNVKENILEAKRMLEYW